MGFAHALAFLPSISTAVGGLLAAAFRHKSRRGKATS